MNLDFVKERLKYFSETTSTIVRQLGFAGIAIIWLFRINSVSSNRLIPPVIPEGLIGPLILIVGGLAFDLFHYISGTISWGFFFLYKDREIRDKRKKNKKVNLQAEFTAPRIINWIGDIFFIVKTIFIILAYIFLFLYLKRVLFPG